MERNKTEYEINENNWFEASGLGDPYNMDPDLVFCQQDKDPDRKKIITYCQLHGCTSLAPKSLLEFKPDDSKHRFKHK